MVSPINGAYSTFFLLILYVLYKIHIYVYISIHVPTHETPAFGASFGTPIWETAAERNKINIWGARGTPHGTAESAAFDVVKNKIGAPAAPILVGVYGTHMVLKTSVVL